MEEFILKLDYYGLLNLHKALLEAKFHPNPDNELVSGSPLVADVYRQVREQLLKSGKSAEWREWFQLKNRPDYRTRAVLRMKKNKRWSGVSSHEREKIAADYLAPFLYDETELKQVIEEVVNG